MSWWVLSHWLYCVQRILQGKKRCGINWAEKNHGITVMGIPANESIAVLKKLKTCWRLLRQCDILRMWSRTTNKNQLLFRNPVSCWKTDTSFCVWVSVLLYHLSVIILILLDIFRLLPYRHSPLGQTFFHFVCLPQWEHIIFRLHQKFFDLSVLQLHLFVCLILSKCSSFTSTA